jgi:hypothetical protein
LPVQVLLQLQPPEEVEVAAVIMLKTAVLEDLVEVVLEQGVQEVVLQPRPFRVMQVKAV